MPNPGNPAAGMDNRKAELLKDQIRHTQEAKTWKDLAYRAFQKQLASKEKTPVSEGLSKIDNPSARRSRLTER